MINSRVRLKRDARVYHTRFCVCLSIVAVCGLHRQECEMSKVQVCVCVRARGVSAAFRGQGKLLEIPGMPEFPRMSRAAVQTQLC